MTCLIPFAAGTVSVPGEADWAAPWEGIDLCASDDLPREAAGFLATSSLDASRDRGRKRGAQDCGADVEGDVEMDTSSSCSSSSSSCASSSSCCSEPKRHASATRKLETKEGAEEKGKEEKKVERTGNSLNLPLQSVPQHHDRKRKCQDFAGIVKVRHRMFASLLFEG